MKISAIQRSSAMASPPIESGSDGHRPHGYGRCRKASGWRETGPARRSEEPESAHQVADLLFLRLEEGPELFARVPDVHPAVARADLFPGFGIVHCLERVDVLLASLFRQARRTEEPAPVDERRVYALFGERRCRVIGRDALWCRDAEDAHLVLVGQCDRLRKACGERVDLA